MVLLAVSLALASPCPADAAPAAQGTVTAERLDEISGVAPGTAGGLWVIEDSGNPAVLTELDPTGAALRTVAVVGAENVDWEDVVAGPCPAGRCLYVADFGDNRQKRKTVRILRVAEPAAGATEATPEVLAYRYAGGPQNAEALTVDGGGRIRVYTKRSDGVTRVYAVDPAFGATKPVVAREIGTLRVDTDGRGGPASRATSAALSPAGDWLLLRTYEAVWAFPAAAEGWDEAGRVRLAAPTEAQGEAIAWDEARQGWWSVSERGDAGGPPTLWFTRCAP